MNSKVKSFILEDLFEIYCDKFKDNRGLFLNFFRENDERFNKTWGQNPIKQINVSLTKEVGSIRGLHYQSKPYEEAKIVQCLKGKVWDVVVDLRVNSKTFGKWCAFELSPDLSNSILIPKGCAHGFQVLEPNSELLYIHSENWEPSHDRGVIWNDETLAISWPLSLTNISEKDKKLPSLSFYEI